MCVIVTSPSKKARPSLETLLACEAANRHGSGIAWIQKGAVYYMKGLTAAGIHDNLKSIRGPVVIHFRIATVGKPQLKLCHPFPITAQPAAKPYGSARAVLFHNGTWQGWDDFAELHDLQLAGPVSDSRIAAAAAAYHGFQWLERIPNRFARLSADGRIEHLGDWYSYAGCMFSNMHWRPDPRPVRMSLYDETPELLENY